MLPTSTNFIKIYLKSVSFILEPEKLGCLCQDTEG